MLRRLVDTLAQASEPMQRAQPGHETVFAAADRNEARQPVQTTPNRNLWNGEDALAFIVADERILFGSVTDKIAVGRPLRLHELELPLQVCVDQEEDAAALGAVIFEHSLRQG